MSTDSIKSLTLNDFYKQTAGLNPVRVLPLDTVICGDCEQVLRTFPDNCVDLIVTSPPYADQRKKTYGGISPDQYVDWFLPKSREFLRILKPDGTFVLNIKERVVDGERHTFVLELILELRKQGWFWTEEYIWNKKNCYPGKWPNRFRDSWERCLQFNKTKKFKMFQDAVMVPVGDWSKTRLKNLNQTDLTRDESKTQSGFGKKISNWVGRDLVYPSNVLNISTECGYKQHSAPFPVALPEWFIRLFTQNDDVVLDPFMGSGTTAVASRKNNRHFIGIDTQPDYCKLAKERVESFTES
jgi:site-specific DNA-methyltransferase (adenine-specific)